MPNRIIKETICTSDTVAQMTDFEFRLWIGMITQADDMGRGDARPAILRGRVFPLRGNLQLDLIQRSLDHLAAIGTVLLYVVDGKPYYAFENWSEHQRIRNVVSKYPGPEDAATCGGLPRVAASCGELPQAAADCGLNPNTNPNTNPNPNTKKSAPTPQKEKKLSFGEHGKVLLTEEEHKKLVEAEGEARTGQAIEFLDSYIVEKDYKSKSHYSSIRRWVFNAIDEPKNNRKGVQASCKPQAIDMARLQEILEKV